MLRLLLLLVLLSSLGRALAQIPELPAPLVARYYLGLSAQHDDFQQAGGNSLAELVVPVQASVGYRLRPRLTLQFALTYSRPTFDYSKLSSRQQSAGSDYGNEYVGQASWRRLSWAVLARYALRRPARRLQLDLLGGYVLQQMRYRSFYQYTYTDYGTNVSSTTSFREGYAYELGRLTAGLGARYRCAQRLEIVLDATLNSYVMALRSVPDPGLSLGLRYGLGSR